MVYGFEPVLKHNLTQALSEAFRGVNTALGGLYTRSHQRLAFRQFVFAYVIREMQNKNATLPLQNVDARVLSATAEELADGFLGEYAKNLGWSEVCERLEEGGDDGPSEQERELRRCLVAYVVQLLQMRTEAGEEMELCELVLSEVDGTAGEGASGDAGEDADEDAASNESENAVAGRRFSQVRSEPEDFQSARPSEAPRRSTSLLGRLGAFVGGDEKAKRRRRNQKNHQRQRVKKRLEREAEEKGEGFG